MQVHSISTRALIRLKIPTPFNSNLVHEMYNDWLDLKTKAWISVVFQDLLLADALSYLNGNINP